MTTADRERWDGRHREAGPVREVGPPREVAHLVGEMATTGRALDIACGRGAHSVWLALLGLDVTAVDVSPAAIRIAEETARRLDVGDRCDFDVWDLDAGLPPGPQVDVLLCWRFRDAALDEALLERLAPGGLLVVSALSVVGAEHGRFRARRGELVDAYRSLDLVAESEADGLAWMVARRPDAQPN